jgi:hypothetical protein
MRIKNYLSQSKESMPEWLANYTIGNSFDIKVFLNHRVVFYPGAGTDGHPVKLFGSSHSAHSFVYADYGLERSEIERNLDHGQHGFLGYHSLSRINLEKRDITPSGCTFHLREASIDYRFAREMMKNPYGFLEILERDKSLTDEYGPSRLAILFLGADGIATYDAIFCQNNDYSKAPFAILIQDHGWGGNYTRFDQGGLLEKVAIITKRLPEYLLIAHNSKPWSGYTMINEPGDRGGMHNSLRFLWKLKLNNYELSDMDEHYTNNPELTDSRNRRTPRDSSKLEGKTKKTAPFDPFRPKPGTNPNPKHYFFNLQDSL